MRYIFINHAMPRETENILSRFGHCVRISPLASLPAPVAAHPDMQIARLGDKFIVHEENKALISFLKEKNIPFSAEQTAAGAVYPMDVALNCFGFSGYFFCSRYTSQTAYATARSAGLIPVMTKQGYTKCSCLIAGKKIITADSAIAHACKAIGADCLEICAGHIGIDGYDYGFIGGASGVIGDTVIFFGDIMRHPDGEKIKEAILSQNMNIISASEDMLFDYGGIVTTDI